MMKSKVMIKCQNCGATEFQPTQIGWINACEGSFTVNAYACQNCGHIELFAPELDLYAKQLREEREAQRRQQELESIKKEEQRQQRIKELCEIINNEDSTVRQVNEAKKELEQLNTSHSLTQKRISEWI